MSEEQEQGNETTIRIAAWVLVFAGVVYLANTFIGGPALPLALVARVIFALSIMGLAATSLCLPSCSAFRRTLEKLFLVAVLVSATLHLLLAWSALRDG